MKIRVKVKWSFDDTEFEHLRYPEAISAAGLPKSVTIKDYDPEEIDIESYLIEEYQFDPVSWEIIE